ncbi:MAG: HAMP domain-containing histidine kinase [Cyclobacteriaceae bacterium]|nr:HAMP domain-containing histidine kinase [Cyclobacteriaceae bacterium]
MAKRDGFNLYENKSNLKWVVLAISVIIGGGSIFYTNFLVEKLQDRERSFIRLYAKTLEFTLSESVTINQDINFISEEIIYQNNSIPMIIMDSLGVIYGARNIEIDSSWTRARINNKLRSMVASMKKDYPPIRIAPIDQSTGQPYLVQYLYYKNSALLTQLTYYPYVQLSVIAIFGFIAYMAFNYSRVAEQNRVWVGMAKETAHQLGTPISSLMAWIEHLKTDPGIKDVTILEELDKDVHKLGLITERFSNIGSVPKLTNEDIMAEVERVIAYLRPRISSKVEMKVRGMNEQIFAQINVALFEWVIENVCKNAVDAMGGEGKLEINVLEGSDWRVFVDISDTGKGINPSKVKQVFNPGFTTKQRGWGLGLALAKRIIENYHKGKIYVKSTTVDHGTTFRIVLNRLHDSSYIP